MSKAKVPTLGSDAEVFLTTLDGAVIPAYGKVGGTKAKPLPMKGLPKGFAYQEDGAAFEFNIAPAHDPDMFSSHIDHAMRWATKWAASQALVLDPTKRSSHQFSAEQLKHPLANVIGCSQDQDAFKGGASRPPFKAKDFGNWRFTGGHIHLDVLDRWHMPRVTMAQLVDMFVYSPLRKHDPQTARSTYYGSPGIYRDKPYGIEFRSMSSFWITPTRAYALGRAVWWLYDALDKRIDELADVYSQMDLSAYNGTLKVDASSHALLHDWKDITESLDAYYRE